MSDDGTVDKAKGRVKEAAGDLTGDQSLKNEGKVDRASGSVKDKVGDAANRREAMLNLWTVDPIEQEYVRTVMSANEKRMNAEALRVLTPKQRKIWDRFTAQRALAEKAPEMRAPSEVIQIER